MAAVSQALGTLYLELVTETREFINGLQKSADAVKKFADDLKNAIEPIAQTAAALTAVGVGAVSVASSIDSKAAESFKRLKKASELLATNISDVLGPAVRELAKDLEKIAGIIGGLSKEARGLVSELAVMTVKVGLTTKAISVLMGLVSGLSASFKILVTIISSKVIAVIAALSSAVIALHAAWRTNWMDMKDNVLDAIDAIKEAFRSVGEFIYNSMATPIAYVVLIMSKLIDAVVDVAKAMPGKLVPEESVRQLEAMSWALNEFGKGIVSGDVAKKAFEAAFDFAKGVAKGAANEVKTMGEEIADFLGLKGLTSGKARDPEKTSGFELKTWDDMVEQINQARASIQEVHKAQLEKDEAERQFLKQAAAAEYALTGDLRELIDFSSSEKRALQSQMMDEWRNLSEYWGDVVKDMQKHGESMGAVAGVWFGRMRGVFERFLYNDTGALGQTIQAVAEGFKAGGIWGGIIAFMMEIVKQMKSFQGLLKIWEYGLKRLGEFFEGGLGAIFEVISKLTAVGTEMIGSIIEAIQPIFEIFADALNDIAPWLEMIGMLFQYLAPIIKMLADLISAFSDALKPVIKVIFQAVMWILGSVVQLIDIILSGIVQAVAWVVSLFDKKAADNIRRYAIELHRSAVELDKLKNTSWDDMQAQADLTAAKWKEKAGVEDLTKTIKDLNDSFQNVPEGYKIALTRWRSIVESEANSRRDPLDGGGPTAGRPGSGDIYIKPGVSIPVRPSTQNPAQNPAQAIYDRIPGMGGGSPIVVAGDIVLNSNPGTSLQLARDIQQESARVSGGYRDAILAGVAGRI